MNYSGNLIDKDGNKYFTEVSNFYIEDNNKDILNTFTRFAVLNFGTNIELAGIIIPKYSKGLLITHNSNDASLIAIDYNGNLYTVFRNSNNWENGRKL